MRFELLKYLRGWSICGKAKDAIDQSLQFTNFLCLLHLTNTYICSTTIVYGPSMLPTLKMTGDVLLVEHVSPLLGKLECGDIVVVQSPDNPRKTISKRILGMEGDKVTFLLDPNQTHTRRTVKVPKGHVWVQGDNVYASKDSRQLGPIPYGLVLGRAFYRVWPPNGFGSLS
ncbi:protease [Lithospermum erythrorhizon]|uniref:Protease n=1 Tax=Lithospermum erythrorhizon TaxID=34254 RepID=A0AAV3RFA1_LITER